MCPSCLFSSYGMMWYWWLVSWLGFIIKICNSSCVPWCRVACGGNVLRALRIKRKLIVIAGWAQLMIPVFYLPFHPHFSSTEGKQKAHLTTKYMIQLLKKQSKCLMMTCRQKDACLSCWLWDSLLFRVLMLQWDKIYPLWMLTNTIIMFRN